MAERTKLELQLNKSQVLELLYDHPVIGQSQFGEYYLYSVRNGNSQEYSFFAPEEVHNTIKSLRKGDKFEILKSAEQVGKKIVTRHSVTLLEQPKQEKPPVKQNGNGVKDSYFQAMLQSYQDALRIQEQLNGMCDVNRIAITLFIARSKLNGNGF